MKKIATFLIILILVAVGGWYGFIRGIQMDAELDAQVAQGVPVSTYNIQMQDIPVKYELPGRVTPYRQSQIRPQVNGIITERLFKEGADVKRGDQLYQIDDARYRAALNSAKADLNSAKANIKSVEAKEKRYKELVKISAVSKQEYDDAKAQYDQASAAIAVAEAAVDVAQVNLDYTKVYAPIDGRIGRSLVTEGALVTANQADYLSVITQINPVYIDMQQSGVEAMRLRKQMMGKGTISVKLILDEASSQVYDHHGSLEFSEITVDETTGSISLRALMPNPDGILLTGLFVRANIDLGTETALLIPQRAVIRNAQGGLSTWVVDDATNQVNLREFEANQAYGTNWIVTKGLEVGEKVVVEGYQKLSPGVSVAGTSWQQGSEESQTQNNSQE